ncbi:MAG: hypothetical protein ACLP9C_08590 [Acidimicrobiales bacterium]
MPQLSHDGHWFWDGHEWQPARLSADGKWHWDGGRWLPVPPLRQAPSPAPPARAVGATGSAEGPDPETVELDDRRFAEGKAPDAVGQLPSEAIVRLAYVAIGWGWVARRVVRWHVCRFEHVQSVALVAPNEPGDPGGTHPMAGSLPQLVLRDFFGRVLRIEVLQMSPLARKELFSQVPMSAVVTPAADLFLEHGELPGEWNRMLEKLGPR